MTIHYHGTPITPKSVFETLGGHHFCVSFYDFRDVKRCHQIGQSVMIDNGAYSYWTQGLPVNWDDYYQWAGEWLRCPTTWAVIPDVIDGTEKENDELVKAWPFAKWKGAPVWHVHESLMRLVHLANQFPRICFGSSGEFTKLGTPGWKRRISQAFETLDCHFAMMPMVHMLRGMKYSGSNVFPFASADSVDVARNHKDRPTSPALQARKWDSMQCCIRWNGPVQKGLFNKHS